MRIEQVVKSDAEKAAAEANKKKKARKRKPGTLTGKPGHPKGSRNREKTQVKLTAELARIQSMVQELLGRVWTFLPLT